MPKLGVNVDHVATVRQARGGKAPDPVTAAREAIRGGADGITVHLREDRRHIQERDLWRLKKSLSRPLNLEMALHPEIIRIAKRLRPQKVCIVPERRREVTTEGGLDILAKQKALRRTIPALRKRGIEVSLFINPVIEHVRRAQALGADAVELHTGAYANANQKRKKAELGRLRKAAAEAHALGLRAHAGHGLDYENTPAVARLPHVRELNIGHAIVARALFVGMRKSVQEMKRQCAI